jgi:hypothetical protein
MLERKYAAYVARKHLERHDELDRERENELKRMEERRQRYVREPWLMIADTYRKAFCCAGNDDWLAWLKSACNEFGVRAVEAWHDEALDAAAKPDSWYFLREFLNKCATKAREEEQP